MHEPVQFFVESQPRPQGNHRMNKRGKLYESSKGHDAWRAAVVVFARAAMRGRDPLPGPIKLTLHFWLPRPKSVSIEQRPNHTVKPDLVKLTRAVEDSLTVKGGGGVIGDDSEIDRMDLRKDYADAPHSIGCSVTVESRD